MTTIVIDESSKEGKAFVELLRQMKFARVLEGESDWWVTISPAEREAIKKGIADIENGKTLSHEQMQNRYAQWLQDWVVRTDCETRFVILMHGG